MTLKDVLREFHKHGVPLDFAASSDFRPSWDGESVAAHQGHRSPHTYLAYLLHELAHWLLCPPQYRYMVNYGLGLGQDDGTEVRRWWMSNPEERKKHFRPLDSDVVRNEEECASLLGIIYEAKLGGRFGKTLREHYWDDPSDPQVLEQTVADLKNAELLSSRSLLRAADLVVSAIDRLTRPRTTRGGVLFTENGESKWRPR